MSRYKDVKPGLNNVASYQVGGRPFCSGSINANGGGDLGNGPGSGPVCVKFPAVTQWIHIINHGAGAPGTGARYDLKVAFSRNGLPNGPTTPAGSPPMTPAANTSYFIVPEKGSEGPQHHQVTLHVKCTELWFTGSGITTTGVHPFDVVAGLTNIATSSCATTTGPSWSGSLGVG